MKDIVCYDVETTGLNSQKDFIIQLSLIKFKRDTWEIIGERDWYIEPIHAYEIDPKAQEVHGITKEFLKENGVCIKDIAQDFLEFTKDCDFLTYNGNTFDIKFLVKDFKTIGVDIDMDRKFYDAYALECMFTPRNLSSIYKKYTGLELENAHNSLSDVRATIEVFKNQLSINEFGWDQLDELKENNLLCANGCIRRANIIGDDELIVFSAGKYKDSDVNLIIKKDPDYFKWFWNNVADERAKKILQKYYKERKQS